MSMEFFAWPWADGFFGADARKFRYSHLAGALTFIPTAQWWITSSTSSTSIPS